MSKKLIFNQGKYQGRPARDRTTVAIGLPFRDRMEGQHRVRHLRANAGPRRDQRHEYEEVQRDMCDLLYAIFKVAYLESHNGKKEELEFGM
jgi:hypothetical protein